MTQTVSAKMLAQECESAMSALERTAKLLGEACRRAHRDSDDGISGGGGEAVSGTRTVDRATAERAISLAAKPDPVRSAATRLADSLYAANHAAGLALLAASSLVAMDPKKVAIELGDTPSICICCGRDVWNTVSDRRRAERCYSCWDWWREHENTNCSQEVHNRRDELRAKRQEVAS